MSADDARLERPEERATGGREPDTGPPTGSRTAWTGSVRWADAASPQAWMPGGEARTAGEPDDATDEDPPADDPSAADDAPDATPGGAGGLSGAASVSAGDGAVSDEDTSDGDEISDFARRLSDDPRTGAMPIVDVHAVVSQKEEEASEQTIYELRSAAQRLEEVLIGGKRVLTRKEVAQLAEVSTASARKLWRALGQPRIPEGEEAFTVSDAAPLRRIADLIDPLQDVMVYAWRRNLAGALSRLNVNVEETLGIGGTFRGQDPTMPLARGIGFIDLVSYTRLSQQLDSRELGRLVKHFQFLAYNIVAAGGGKVIKTVGDEVFFAAETPLAGAEIAMTLLEQVRADESLPKCRVGYAWGRVLSRMGDIFGTTVNLAARLTAIAEPSTVVTDADTARILERDDAFRFSGRQDLNLQGLGEVGVVEIHRDSAPRISTEDIS